MVLGYGRCGKVLANMLKGIGALVTVSYRNDDDSAYIEANGFDKCNIYEIKSCIKNFDFIFNTIPACILDKFVLKQVLKSTIIIDIAQAPGGVDYNYARDLNIKALYCPGLPGRVAPFTAAKILKDSLLNFCLINITEKN